MDKRSFLAAAAWGGMALSSHANAAPRARSGRSPVLLTLTGAIARANRGPIDPALDQMMVKQKVSFDKARTFEFSELAAMNRGQPSSRRSNTTASGMNWPGRCWPMCSRRQVPRSRIRPAFRCAPWTATRRPSAWPTPADRDSSWPRTWTASRCRSEAWARCGPCTSPTVSRTWPPSRSATASRCALGGCITSRCWRAEPELHVLTCSMALGGQVHNLAHGVVPVLHALGAAACGPARQHLIEERLLAQFNVVQPRERPAPSLQRGLPGRPRCPCCRPGRCRFRARSGRTPPSPGGRTRFAGSSGWRRPASARS